MKDKNKSENKDNRKKDKSKFGLTELFMAKAGWKRCFIGSLKRRKDANGNEMLFSKVNIKKSIIISQADDRDKLGNQLDILCEWVLDHNLHDTSEVSSKIFEAPFFHN